MFCVVYFIVVSTLYNGIYSFEFDGFFSKKAPNNEKTTTDNFFSGLRRRAQKSPEPEASMKEDSMLGVLKMVPLGCTVIRDCQDKLLTFHLYTRPTQENPYLLDLANPTTIQNAPFDKNAPLKFIAHEYWGGKDSTLNQYLRKEYFNLGDYNIVAMDFELLVKYTLCYPVALASVSTVGKCGAKLLDAVFEAHPCFAPDSTHVIAFSFGAHVSSWVSASLQKGTISRLTWLEPALPMYDKNFNQLHHQKIEARASFIDVYHTNIGICSFKNPIGTVDVYFNNGVRQPGCYCNNSCDHVRVVDYYAESIISKNGMWGFPCPGWQGYLEGECNVEEVVLLGEHIRERTRGVYYVFTGSESPYFLSASDYTKNDTKEHVDVRCKFDQVYDQVMQEE